ncbi:hypothetical protein BCR44DRAFT_391693 [Catenaria anguillulae PL171]|uniref:Uncharacterized protein n=1 Tax=Catenaria anguillulae PL171 TaxID=765915 RepID=A0A1Y2HTZ3_9FUNG|nr:hypothetical protein BCR44DRAFT_391693 [Catenaria anguillulae PL171]
MTKTKDKGGGQTRAKMDCRRLTKTLDILPTLSSFSFLSSLAHDSWTLTRGFPRVLPKTQMMGVDRPKSASFFSPQCHTPASHESSPLHLCSGHCPSFDLFVPPPPLTLAVTLCIPTTLLFVARPSDYLHHTVRHGLCSSRYFCHVHDRVVLFSPPLSILACVGRHLSTSIFPCLCVFIMCFEKIWISWVLCHACLGSSLTWCLW